MTIVVGYVPKPEGRAALQRAVDEALLRQARLVVVNASRGDAHVDPGLAPEDELEAVRRRLADVGIEHEVHQLVRGKDGAEEVLAAAVEAAATLIVIGLRRRTPVGKLIMGSNAQRILLDATCPVLAVKSDAP